jgi:hypothetical protein
VEVVARERHEAPAMNAAMATRASATATTSEMALDRRAARAAIAAGGASRSSTASSSSSRASLIWCSRRADSFCRHRRSSRRSAIGIVSGSAVQSGSRNRMLAITSVASSPPKARHPVSIS